MACRRDGVVSRRGHVLTRCGGGGKGRGGVTWRGGGVVSHGVRVLTRRSGGGKGCDR